MNLRAFVQGVLGFVGVSVPARPQFIPPTYSASKSSEKM